MKQLSTAMTGAVAGAILLGSLGLGLAIRKARTSDVQTPDEPKQEIAGPMQEKTPAEPQARRDFTRDDGLRRTGAAMPGMETDPSQMRAQWENMSEQERAEFRDRMRERMANFRGGTRGEDDEFGGRRRGGFGGRGGRTGRVMLTDEDRAKMENMTDEQRQQYIEEVRERIENMTDEEREAMREQMRARFEERRRQMQQMQDDGDAPPEPAVE